MKRSEIRLTGLQIKSVEKARLLAAMLHTIEIECGIRTTRLTLDDCFVCPEIDWTGFDRTPMEKHLRDIVRMLHKRQGVKSNA